MPHHSHANPWLYLVIAPFILWGVVTGVIRGRLRLGGTYGSYTIKRSSEPVPFWAHVFFALSVSLIMIAAGINGMAIPEAPVPWMGAHARQNFFFAAGGAFAAVLFVAYAVEGRVPSVARPITRKDRPVNYYLTLLIFLGMAVYFIYSAWQAWPWVVASTAPAR